MRYEYTTEDYEEAKHDAFRDGLHDEMSGMTIEEMDEEFFSDFILNFDFIEEGDWIAIQYENDAEAYGDDKREQMRDER